MHEIVTVQLGQQANYVGTHYWNAQESYFTYAGQEDSPVNHDVSFRAGIGSDGSDTYTPRTLIYDLKGAFGTLRRENALYSLQNPDNPAQGNPWSGSTVPLHLPPVAPSPYQQALDAGVEPPILTTETVRFWSDYNRVFYHPRSIVQLNEYELNSSLMPFEQWQTGDELFDSLDHEHDLVDRDLRPLLEECDQLQAIQIFSTVDDAWGGFASKYLESMSDELGKGCRWVFGLQDSQQCSRERKRVRMLCVAQSLNALNGTASMHFPLVSTPTLLPAYVSLEGFSRWHTSALQTAAIESATLVSRLRESSRAKATFDDLETLLSGDGKRRIAACGLSVASSQEMTSNTQVNGHDSRMTNGHVDGVDDEEYETEPASESNLDIVMFPTDHHPQVHQHRQTKTLNCSEMLRGSWEGASNSAGETSNGRGTFTNDMRRAIHHSGLLFPVLSSFPNIFRFSGHPTALAVKSRLSTSKNISAYIRSVESMARQLAPVAEREALCDELVSMAEEYEDGWLSDDDESDEDE